MLHVNLDVIGIAPQWVLIFELESRKLHVRHFDSLHFCRPVVCALWERINTGSLALQRVRFKLLFCLNAIIGRSGKIFSMSASLVMVRQCFEIIVEKRWKLWEVSGYKCCSCIWSFISVSKS